MIPAGSRESGPIAVVGEELYSVGEVLDLTDAELLAGRAPAASTRGEPRTIRTASGRSPEPDGCSLPRASTVEPTTAPAQPASAITTTSAALDRRSPRASTWRTVRCNNQR